MNNSELNRVLKAAHSPPRSDDYWEEFPGRVTRQLSRPLPPERRPATWLPRLAWAGGIAVVCVMIGFGTGRRHGEQDAVVSNGLLQNARVIQEVMAMFPNRVRAIINDEEGMQIVLSDADLPDSIPLWVKVCRGNLCTTLVTFSGQEVMVAGQKLTVLEDAENGVILTGDRFAWTSNRPGSGIQDLRIQAMPLQLASLP